MRGIYILINKCKKCLRGCFFLRPWYVYMYRRMVEVLHSFFFRRSALTCSFLKGRIVIITEL